MGLVIHQVTKTFGQSRAVDDVSFTVTPGRIFGFLGTNGAGKTTTMRMILDIIRPDSGRITWNGLPNSQIPRHQFGYLPEERGLYPKMAVDEQLLFLAQLYGAERKRAEALLDSWLERLDITMNRSRRIEELSKGNQQKVQFLAAILHDPDILILDEPFSGLDPVNADQMKQAFVDLREQGKTIIFSTHQLNDAQELCHEVVIIHQGRLMTSGEVGEVRRSMGRQVVRFALGGHAGWDGAHAAPAGAGIGVPHGNEALPWIEMIPGVAVDRVRDDGLELSVPDETTAQEVLREALRRGESVTRFDISDPSLNDVFLHLVRRMPDDASVRQDERVAVTV